MSHYIDGFLLPLATEHVERYQEIANLAGAVWMEHGALAYWECVGDELSIPEMVDFRHSAGCKGGETVVLAWIVYPSKEERDRINALVMADPRMGEMMGKDDVPFDYRRMAQGGFKKLVGYQ